MTDIVQRLHVHALTYPEDEVIREAAEEITRLRKVYMAALIANGEVASMYCDILEQTTRSTDS